MPELPEVETIRGELDQKIKGKKLVDIWVEKSFYKKISPKPRDFIGLLKNQKIKRVSRKAKLLILEINADLFLLIHLKMTGQLVYKPQVGEIISGGHPIEKLKILPNKFTRVIFSFSDKAKLYFNDIRKFGFLKLVNNEDLNKELSNYGLEPLDPAFTFKYFDAILARRPNTAIKTFLLDQKLLAGLGNIYADEVCFLAGVLPTRLTKDLTQDQTKLIFLNTKKVLKKAIKYKGTSFNTYVNSAGVAGGFQKFLNVYGRKGEKCKRCKIGTIEKIKINGRSSSFCPNCQK